jgi:hypothetical protein
MVRNAALASAAALLYLTSAVLFVLNGLLKFHPYEAEAIAPLIASNPLVNWLPDFIGADMVARLAGGARIAGGYGDFLSRVPHHRPRRVYAGIWAPRSRLYPASSCGRMSC